MLLSTRGLSKQFAGLRAVEGVDFDLPKGEIHALIGPNGAGKTTLVGMISGRIAPTAGRVLFDGQDITRLPAHRRMRLGMAYTFQITSVFARLSVAENVALAARRRAHGGQVNAVIDEVLERVGLPDRKDQEAGDLAYGHQRLLEIAMGIAQRPRLLILDEPTQGLAEGEIEGFKILIRDLAQEATILLIEHNMHVVMELAGRITVMNFGAVLAEGTPEQIRASREVQAAYLGGTSDAAAG
ncbi:amino acid/amide ABC transporter ATP-binding protein 1, HAAT family [Roseovarius azorensis]|uniref:Amino acid/amide ABC transporter ATP-binding protein 1, HAAT family n=2 Tax=Roseovarius azorensis TaxID=1287727 RepID=A0A1H7JPN7_9RHOB|nr:amino acid/amide ABC transporter ATP-binding protein 1, HAAT family [Roseovarius azorensis]